MKPDHFDDNVRRKLDGIEPVFREKDWAQMQQVMRQHGLITPWSAAPSWLLPAAGVVSVAALLTATVWLGHTNGQLRQDVQRLNQTVTQLKQTPPAALPRTDTVYVTRVVPTPTNTQTNPYPIEPNLSVSQSTPARDRAVETQPQTDGLTSPADRNPIAGQPSMRAKPLTESSAPVDRRPDRPDVALANRPERLPDGRTSQPTAPTGVPERRSEAVGRPDAGTSPVDAAGNRTARTAGTGRNQNGTRADRIRADRSVSANGHVETVTPSATSGQTGGVTLERLIGKPVRLDSVHFEEGISQAVRRLRRLYPAKALPVLPTLPTAAPEATAVVTPNDHFRLGLTGELGLNQWSLGLYGDVLIGKHLLIGLGLERVNISGGQYLTDYQFNRSTKRDFRRDYARGIDNRHDIININRRSVTWQVPVTLGYRIPVGYGIALTPTLGISTSLTANEIVNFTYRRGPGEFPEAEFTVPRPVAWYHSWSTSVGIEKRWGPLTVQASPYLVGPFTDSPLGLNGTSGGLRLRTLYSF